MAWTLTLNGLATTLEAEREVIDRIAQFIETLGEEVAHVWTTEFHGAGDTNNLVKNVAPAPEAPEPLAPVSPAEPTPVPGDQPATVVSSDPTAVPTSSSSPTVGGPTFTGATTVTDDAARPAGDTVGAPFDPKPADEQSTPAVTDPGASPAGTDPGPAPTV